MATDEALRTEVRKYCTAIARDRLLVQAAGGNVSWKSECQLWIKASGTWLAEAENKEIFVPVDRQPLDEALALGDFSVTPKALDGHTLRPSIETLLHVLMPHRVVVHLHPVEAVARLIHADCRTEVTRLLGSDLNWAMVDYFKPGADLAKAVHEAIHRRPEVNLILLANHGVILGGDNVDQINALLEAMVAKLGTPPREIETPTPYISEFEMAGYEPVTDPSLHRLATDDSLYGHLQDNWAICPDHVVFLGAQACRVRTQDRLTQILAKGDAAPPFVFVKGVGTLQSQTATAAQKAQLLFYLDVMVRQAPGQQLALLRPDQIGSLLNWDAEKYRIQLNR